MVMLLQNAQRGEASWRSIHHVSDYRGSEPAPKVVIVQMAQRVVHEVPALPLCGSGVHCFQLSEAQSCFTPTTRSGSFRWLLRPSLTNVPPKSLARSRRGLKKALQQSLEPDALNYAERLMTLENGIAHSLQTLLGGSNPNVRAMKRWANRRGVRSNRGRWCRRLIVLFLRLGTRPGTPPLLNTCDVYSAESGTLSTCCTAWANSREAPCPPLGQQGQDHGGFFVPEPGL